MDGFTTLPHQAAGHPGVLMDTSEGNLFAKQTTQQEIDFYTSVYAKDLQDEGLDLLPLLGDKVEGTVTTQIKTGVETAEEYGEEDFLGSRLSDWMPLFIGRLDSGVTKELEEKGIVDPKELQSAKQQQQQQQEQGHLPKKSQGQSEDSGEESATANGKIDNGANVTKEQISEKPYIVLENILYGYNYPSVIDIKLGKLLTDDTVSNEKRQRLAKVSKDTTSGSLGFRICGMKTFNNRQRVVLSGNYEDIIHSEDLSYEKVKETELGSESLSIGQDQDESKEYVSYNKYFGRKLTKDNVINGFKIFFIENDLTQKQQKKILTMTIQRLQLLHNCLIDAEVRLKSSSLLIIFENDFQRWEENQGVDPLIREDFESDDEDSEFEEESENEDGGDGVHIHGEIKSSKMVPLSSLNLIDFAHSKLTPGMGPDDNVLDGVESLLTILEKLLIELE